MILIKNGYIKTMAGEDIENGCILIGDDGKIAEIGKDINVCSDVQIIDAEGRLVTPGCIDGHCHIGLDNELTGLANQDHNERIDPITPQMRAIDSINPIDTPFEEAIMNGVTAACTGPGSANVVGGTFAAIKLVGKNVDKMVIKHPIAMKCAFGENPKKVYGQGKGKSPYSRMGIAYLLRELLTKAKKYSDEDAAGKEHNIDLKLEAMIPVMRKEIPLKAHAHQADDILTAIRIAKEFDVNLTIDHCTDGAVIADELKEAGYPVCFGPTLGSRGKYELRNKHFDTAAKLNDAGIEMCIITDSPVIPICYLPLCAALAVKHGLDKEAAWRAITVNPAKIAGIFDRVGSLEVGKDADVVIWTDDPMTAVAARSFVTVVDGKVVYSM